MKIAVIGAGINGLYIGKKLAELGHKVTIFEKKKEIGNNVCSGLFSMRLLDFIPEAEKLTENRIKSVIIHFPKKTIKVVFSKEFLVMSHSKLDKLIADLAAKKGVKILLDNNIKELPNSFDIIIGCDGYDSIVRKKLKLNIPSLRLGIQGFVNEKWNADFVEVWPQKNGFLWKIPRKNEIEYGVISNPFTASWLLKDFIKKQKVLLENIKSKIIPQGIIIPDNSEITLCGDAAGLTKPWSGGGVIWGLIAADILIKNLPDLKGYKAETLSFFKRKIWLSKIALKFVYFFGFKFPWIIPSKLKMESDFLF